MISKPKRPGYQVTHIPHKKICVDKENGLFTYLHHNISVKKLEISLPYFQMFLQPDEIISTHRNFSWRASSNAPHAFWSVAYIELTIKHAQYLWKDKFVIQTAQDNISTTFLLLKIL